MDKTTHFFRTGDTEQKWHVIDAEGKTLGRIATEIARLLRGKHKPTFTPNADLGDYVVVERSGTGASSGLLSASFHDVAQEADEKDSRVAVERHILQSVPARNDHAGNQQREWHEDEPHPEALEE